MPRRSKRSRSQSPPRLHRKPVSDHSEPSERSDASSHVVVLDRPSNELLWEEVDRYSLPPIDQFEYDLRKGVRPQSEPARTLVSKTSSTKSSRSHKVRKSEVATKWTEEYLVKSPRSEWWCRDCPWLIVYGLCLFTWVVLVGLCFFRKHLDYTSTNVVFAYRTGADDETDCFAACSTLLPPQYLPPAEQATFHCVLTRRWEGANGTISYDNPNCIQDCSAFGNVYDFLASCAERYSDPVDGLYRAGGGYAGAYKYHAPIPISAARNLDQGGLSWHWIVHVMVMTNTLALFLLLVPLFFCCLQVVIFSVTSVVITVALTLSLWIYVYENIADQGNQFEPKNELFIRRIVFAILSTILMIYVVAIAIFVSLKRNRVSCAVARFTSKFVNSVPTILLEALLTLILLMLWAVAVLFASFAIERGGETTLTGPDPDYNFPLWFMWMVRVLTGIIGFWTAQFIINCQTIIIHGAMARFYFAKELKNRVIKSHLRLLKYHLCTACFSALLFNWLYWLRWIRPESRIRSRSLFATAALGSTFCKAGREVNHLLHPPEGSRHRAISKVNPYYFLVHIQTFAIMAFVTHLVFYHWNTSLYIELILVGYAYFVGLSSINIYRVTKDSIFLCNELDRALTSEDPGRILKMPYDDTSADLIFARDSSRVNPR